MITLDHIAIYTDHLERLKDFYVRYFNAMPNDEYHNPKTGLRTYFLSFGDGSRIEIMSRSEITSRNDTTPILGLTHLAFRVGSKEAVDRLMQKLLDDGFVLKSSPRTTGDGYYESCVLDPDLNEVEIVA
jgi:lactoylglutathione lyase